MEFVSRSPFPGETVMDYSLLGGAHAERGRKLFLTGLGLLAATLAYLAYTANVQDTLHLAQGLVIFVLAAVPALMWARSGGSRFPVFEPIMLLCANAYALPMLNAQEQLAGYSPEIITRAGLAVIAYQLCAIIVYATTIGIPGRSEFWRGSVVTRGVERTVIYGLALSTVYIGVSTFTTWIPREYESVLRAVFYGVGILSTFVTTQRWGRGDLSQGEKVLLVCALVPQLVFMCTSLILIGALSLVGIGLLGYLSGGKRIPWTVIALSVLVLIVLHTGKTKMREKYWDDEYPAPTVTELPAFYGEWLGHGLQHSDDNKSASRKLLERTSLMHILCLIVSYTPERQPYLYGKSYGHVLPQLIPRLLWPEKPRSHIATYELAIYYGLQSEEDTATTTIAFGLLTEAYANFGLLGALLLGGFWGFCLKKLQIWSMLSPIFSPAGLLMILLTAWSFNAELTMAAWVSSLFQAVIVVLGIPMLLRSLFAG